MTVVLSIMLLLMFQRIKLVYASSSSVYGPDSDVPFRVSSPPQTPANMYAATKRSDELLVLHYCLSHHIRAVGLRFFTVYGEWGRPDMSVYKFAEAIVQQKEIPMFFVRCVCACMLSPCEENSVLCWVTVLSKHCRFVV